MNDKLRREVKALKAFQSIRYKEIAEYLEISLSGMYGWINGAYDLGYEKQKRLEEIISCLKE